MTADYSEERSGSFQTRIDNEEKLLEKAERTLHLVRQASNGVACAERPSFAGKPRILHAEQPVDHAHAATAFLAERFVLRHLLEIADDLESALEQFTKIAARLGPRPAGADTEAFEDRSRQPARPLDEVVASLKRDGIV